MVTKQMGSGLRGWMKKVRGIKKDKLPIKYSIGTRVSNVVITAHDVRWVLGLSG